MFGFNIIIYESWRVSFFIDKDDKIYHFRNNKFSYDLDEEETELLERYGIDTLIHTVKKMKQYEVRNLDKVTKLERFY